MTSSYRQILRSSSIIGGASVINIILGLVRMKAAALLLGPAGVGLIGVFSNLIGVAISVAGMGLSNAGTRQIAEAAGNEDAATVAAARRALIYMTAVMAVLGSIVFWLLRGVLAEFVLNDSGRSAEVGWLAFAVGLSIAASSQEAMLNGLRRIGDLSRLSVYAAFWSSLLGVAALWVWGYSGVVFYVIAVPFVGFLFGRWYVSKLPSIDGHPVSIPAITQQSRAMLKLGSAFMLTSSIGYSGLLLVRSMVQDELGIDALGYFQAASAISMTYIGFVINAMSRDYFPRLTAVIEDQQAVNRMVNEQTEISLLLAGPVFLAMMALAPWVIELLYSRQFHPAADVLHWQIIGDILKVASWPIAYILVASGDGKTFVKNEVVGFISIGVLTWIFLPRFGIAGSGMAFLGMTAISTIILYRQAMRRTKFIWQPEVTRPLLFLLMSTSVLLLVARNSLQATALLGVTLSAGYAVYAFSRLAHKTSLTGRLGRLALFAQACMKRIGVWHE